MKYPNHEITNLSRVYRELFNQHLDVDIKKKTSGDIEDALELFLMPLPAMEARVLNRAFKGLGTDEEVVIELLCLRTDEQLRAIAQAYQDQYSQTLADRLAEELSGKEEKLFASLVRASRQDGKDNEVEAHATRLYEAAEKRLVGNDNKVFVDFLTNFSRGYVDKVALAYKRKYSKPLHVAIEREFSGVFQKALMALSTPIVNYYANAFLVNFQRLNMDEMKLVCMSSLSINADPLSSGTHDDRPPRPGPQRNLALHACWRVGQVLAIVLRAEVLRGVSEVHFRALHLQCEDRAAAGARASGRG